MRIIVDMIEYCTENVPQWNTISISGYHIREAGATAAQELAFTLANGFAYVEAALERGLDIDARSAGARSIRCADRSAGFPGPSAGSAGGFAPIGRRSRWSCAANGRSARRSLGR